jgi:type II secretory pathway component PulF
MLLYPVSVLLVAMVVLPLPLLFRGPPGAYAARVLPGLAVLAALAVFFLVLLPRQRPDAPARRVLFSLGLVFPLTRPILLHRALATFAEVLGGGISAGIPIREALGLAASATPHPAFTAAGAAMIARLDAGGTLSSALAAVSPPPSFVAQLNAAEQAGTLDTTLERLSRTHRDATLRATALVLRMLGATVFAAAAIFAAASIIGGYGAAFENRDRQLEQLLR